MVWSFYVGGLGPLFLDPSDGVFWSFRPSSPLRLPQLGHTLNVCYVMKVIGTVVGVKLHKKPLEGLQVRICGLE